MVFMGIQKVTTSLPVVERVEPRIDILDQMRQHARIVHRLRWEFAQSRQVASASGPTINDYVEITEAEVDRAVDDQIAAMEQQQVDSYYAAIEAQDYEDYLASQCSDDDGPLAQP